VVTELITHSEPGELFVIPTAPSARSEPDWNCDIPSPYRRRA
jgi:hypothetical protein